MSAWQTHPACVAGNACAARQAAEEYAARGWSIVPVAKGEKRPKIDNWPSIDFKPAQINGCNVGVKLGWVSGHLTDIDLDSEAAIALAPYFLPETLTFGRASKPRSHWLYTCEGIRSAKLIFGPKGEMELVEIRSTNASNDDCGHQSVFPGSVHESGETVDWSADDLAHPASISAGELRWRVARLAVAATILRDWTKGSSRHEKTLGLSALLLQQGWTADEVWHCLESVRQAAGGTRKENSDFEQDVRTTIRAFAEGRPVQGVSALESCGVDPLTISQLRKHSRTPETLAKEAQLMQLSAGRSFAQAALAEAREVDDITAAADAVAAFGVQTEQQQIVRDETDPLTLLGEVVDLAAAVAPLDWRIEDVAAPGKVTIVVARPEGGKSPLALWIALCTAAGLPVFAEREQPARQWKTKKCPVLYLDFETGDLAVERLQRMCNALGVERTALELFFVHASRALDPELLEDLHRSALEYGIGLIVIDTYASALPGDIDYNSGQFAHYLRQLGRLSRMLGVTVIVLMHAKKGASDADLEAISGHYGAAGAAQSVIRLVPREGEENGPIEVICARHPRKKWLPFQIQWQDVDAKDSRWAGVNMRGVPWGLLPEASEIDRVRPDRMNAAQSAAAMRDEERQRILRELHRLKASGFHEIERSHLAKDAAGVRAFKEALSRLLTEGLILKRGKDGFCLGNSGPHPNLKR